jgi:drug/metabolite transporter (DMT)-like permease
MMAILSYAAAMVALSHLPSSVSLPLIMLLPFFVGVAAFTYEDELMSKVQVLSLSGCYLGVILMTSDGQLSLK